MKITREREINFLFYGVVPLSTTLKLTRDSYTEFGMSYSLGRGQKTTLSPIPGARPNRLHHDTIKRKMGTYRVTFFYMSPVWSKELPSTPLPSALKETLVSGLRAYKNKSSDQTLICLEFRERVL